PAGASHPAHLPVVRVEIEPVCGLRSHRAVDAPVGETAYLGRSDRVPDSWMGDRLRDLRRARVRGDHLVERGRQHDRELPRAASRVPDARMSARARGERLGDGRRVHRTVSRVSTRRDGEVILEGHSWSSQVFALSPVPNEVLGASETFTYPARA